MDDTAAFFSVSIVGLGIGLILLTSIVINKDEFKNFPVFLQILLAVLLLFLLFSPVLTVTPFTNVVLDYIGGEYIETNGIPRNIETYQSKTTDYWIDKFQINGVTIKTKPLHINEKEFVKDVENKTLYIRYLPRSKYAIYIEKSNNIYFIK